MEEFIEEYGGVVIAAIMGLVIIGLLFHEGTIQALFEVFLQGNGVKVL